MFTVCILGNIDLELDQSVLPTMQSVHSTPNFIKDNIENKIVKLYPQSEYHFQYLFKCINNVAQVHELLPC